MTDQEIIELLNRKFQPDERKELEMGFSSLLNDLVKQTANSMLDENGEFKKMYLDQIK